MIELVPDVASPLNASVLDVRFVPNPGYSADCFGVRQAIGTILRRVT
jgi:RNase adaptor protein for sRNA GlmZ degradation